MRSSLLHVSSVSLLAPQHPLAQRLQVRVAMSATAHQADVNARGAKPIREVPRVPVAKMQKETVMQGMEHRADISTSC